MLQTKHLALPLSILSLVTAAPAPTPHAHTTALLTASFYPNCPATAAPGNAIIDYDPSPSLSFSRDPDGGPSTIDFSSSSSSLSSHFDISSTAPLKPNACVGIPVPLEYSSLLVDHFSVSASVQHGLHRGGDRGRHEGEKVKEKCKITVHELPGCEQDPVLEVPIGEGQRSVESGCVRREFLAFELVWAKLDCEVEVEEVKEHEKGHEKEHGKEHGKEKDADEKEDDDDKKPWTHGGLANSTAPVSHGKKGRLSGGKRRTKLPIF